MDSCNVQGLEIVNNIPWIFFIIQYDILFLDSLVLAVIR